MKFRGFNSTEAKGIGGFILGLAIGYAFGNGHTTQHAIHDLSDQLGRARAHDGCVTKQAKAAIGLAVESENGTNIDLALLPDCGIGAKKGKK